MAYDPGDKWATDPRHRSPKLKRDLDGQIVVYASYQLGHILMEHDLVDRASGGRLPGPAE